MGRSCRSRGASGRVADLRPRPGFEAHSNHPDLEATWPLFFLSAWLGDNSIQFVDRWHQRDLESNGGHQEEQEDVSHDRMLREMGWLGLEMR